MTTLATQAITTALTGSTSTPVTGLGRVLAITLTCLFTYVASAATSAKIYVQTSLDGGSTWFDIACFAFTTASASKYSNVDGNAQIASATLTTGTLADGTCAHGLIGDRLRISTTSVGTYGAGTQAVVSYQTR